MNEQKKPNIIVRLLKKLIFIAIIAGCGYWIYQNGGLPKDGFDLGSKIGWETPEELYSEEQRQYDQETQKRFDEAVALAKLISIVDEAMKYNNKPSGIACGVSYLQGDDKHNDTSYVNEKIGISDYSHIKSIADLGDGSGVPGALVGFLIELDAEADPEQLADEIRSYINPSKWYYLEEYKPYYEHLTPDDVTIETNKNYVFVILVGDEYLNEGRFTSESKLVELFYEVTNE